METNHLLSITDFDYDLPPELIAQEPLDERHSSRLLVMNRNDGDLSHKHFQDLPSLLRSGDLLVVNNTSVIPARLYANRASGGQIRLLLLKPHKPAGGIWEALVSPIKRLKPGEELFVESSDEGQRTIKIVDIVIGHDGFKRLLVDLGPADQVFSLLRRVGQAPLPPYIQRKEEHTERRAMDMDRYQTVFASEPGAVAAPTAGLHFSHHLLAELQTAGIEICYITLHVGPGTFKPIETTVDDHSIEPEVFQVSAQAAQQLSTARGQNRRIIAVGTTSLRAIESAGAGGDIESCDWRSTSLYIKPGYDFKVASGLITNFHLSRSSLLVLVSAFAGRENIMNAYREAIAERYRFFSYGDGMLIF